MGEFCCGTSLTAPARTGLAAVAVARPAPIPRDHARLFARVRAKLWELPESVHCSVVGTCLTTVELRKLLARLDLVRAADTEHDLHGRAVALAGGQTAGARLLHKLLDTTHAGAVRAFATARTEADLHLLWTDALDRGDVPGPYWAVLTHPACSYAVRNEAFGRVHMLSHLVGAANRADLRRLSELEAANARLAEKVERQQARLREQAAASQETVRGLRDALARQAGSALPAAPAADDTRALRGTAADLRRRLDGSERHAALLEARLAEAQAALVSERAAHTAAERRAHDIATELAAAEAALDAGDPVAAPDLDGLSLLYVGGRPHAAPAMHAVATRLGARFTHHDGGPEEWAGLLPGLVGRADAVLFPVDCISHEAALAVKRLCRNGGKPFVPLRSAGLGCFLAALRTLCIGKTAG